MKPVQTVLLPFKEIHPDFFFCFASDSDLATLKASVARSGIRNPLSVLQDQDGYRLCSGFKRFRAAAELGLETVPVRVLSKENPPAEWFRDILLEHLSVRALNLVEKARVLRIVRLFKPSTDVVFESYAELLELPKHPAVIQEVLHILELHPAAVGYVEKFDLPVKTTKGFFLFTAEEQELLIKVAAELSLRPVELFEMASALRETAVRENRTLIEHYGEMQLQEILFDRELNRNEKIGRIKHRLHRAQYPLLSKWNDALEHLRKEAGLPATVHLSWDKSLEAPGLRLHAEIRSADDVNALSEWLSDERHKRLLNEMLKSL